MIKKFLVFVPFFGLGYLKIIRNKHRHIQYSLGCSPDSSLCLCIYFISLFILPNISNSHTPILEHMNTWRLDPSSSRGWFWISEPAVSTFQVLELQTCIPYSSTFTGFNWTFYVVIFPVLSYNISFTFKTFSRFHRICNTHLKLIQWYFLITLYCCFMDRTNNTLWYFYVLLSFLLQSDFLQDWNIPSPREVP